MKKLILMFAALALIQFVSRMAYADITDGLIAYYPFSGNANDESAFGHDGTVSGAALAADRFGSADSAFSFDGVDDAVRVRLPSAPVWHTLGSPGVSYSVSAWFKTDVVQAQPMVIVEKSDGFGIYPYTIWIIDGSVAFAIHNLAPSIQIGGSPVADNEWHHVVGIRDLDAGRVSLYLDGLKIAEAPDAGVTASNFDDGIIGNGGNNFIQYPFTGTIDEVRVYNRAISETEILQLADAHFSCSATHCFDDGVFFTLADSVHESVNYDNDDIAWDIEDEAKDYRQAGNDEPFSFIKSLFPGGKALPGLVAGRLEDYYLNRRASLNCNSDTKDDVGCPLITHMLYAQGDQTAFRIETTHDFDPPDPSRSEGDLIIRASGVQPTLGTKTPLILIHGWQGDDGINNYLGFNTKKRRPEAYFQELLAFYEAGKSGNGTELTRELAEKYKLYLFHYPSFKHITYNGRILRSAILSVRELWDHIQNGGSIKIVAHSMGGLVARSLLEEHGGSEFVSRVITLATPHHGSPAADLNWIDLGDVLKNRETPGALDLMWDDMDFAATEVSEEEPDMQGFPQRVRLDQFDDIYRGGIVGPLSNPWLLAMNRALVREPAAFLERYVLYGGSVSEERECKVAGALFPFTRYCGCRLEAPRDTVKNKGWVFASNTMAGQSGFLLNDGVVPTRSAFLEMGSGQTGMLWVGRDRNSEILDLDDPRHPRVNSVGFVVEALDDICDGASFYIYDQREEADTYAATGTATLFPVRYFFDYDHGKMRGGAGDLDYAPIGKIDPLLFDLDVVWRDKKKPKKCAKLKGKDPRRISSVDYNLLHLNAGVFNTIDRPCTDERLFEEALFQKIVQDLGR